MKGSETEPGPPFPFHNLSLLLRFMNLRSLLLSFPCDLELGGVRQPSATPRVAETPGTFVVVPIERGGGGWANGRVRGLLNPMRVLWRRIGPMKRFLGC